MAAKERLDKYLDLELPADRLLFRVSMLLSFGVFVFVLSMSLLLQMGRLVSLMTLAGIGVTLLSIYREYRTENARGMSAFYFVLVYLIMLPFMACNVPCAICDFPFYYLTGIVFVTVLFYHKRAVFFCAVYFAVVFWSVWHMIPQADELLHADAAGDRYSAVIFFRMFFAMFIMGLAYGVLASFRSRILRRQIQKSAGIEKQAEQLSYAKDMFLVNVSHEIRTPLNAILGVTELMLSQDTDEKLKDSAFQISNSSKALLSITNELMDFSKLNAASRLAENGQYYIGNICDELINMISVRFADYDVGFYADIAPDIPEQLIGDKDAVRQLMMGMVSGVIKSVETGEVYLKVRKEGMDEAHILLRVEINARGSFLYSYRQRLYETAREESDVPEPEEEVVPLPYRLVRLMQGEMDVQEEAALRQYSFGIVQGFVPGRMMVEQPPANVKILCYENTDKRSDALVNALRSMSIEYLRVFDDETFLEKCTDPEYSHIMIAAGIYTGLKERLDALLPPQSLILIGGGVPAYDDALVRTTIARPVSCLNLDALLNGRQSSTVRYISYNGGFVCPEADIMVVDDNVVNLEVATSILGRYEAKVTVAASGKECLGMLKRNKSVDLILLDYMMPEMDGIDTLKNIREMDVPGLKTVPVVALTANAVSGAREMFMDAGFDEYISKPIEREKLEKVLKDCLPEDKVVYVAER